MNLLRDVIIENKSYGFHKEIYIYFRFKSLLASSGPDGSPNKEIEISDVKYNIFQVTILFSDKKVFLLFSVT